jgi:hypothetical protein
MFKNLADFGYKRTPKEAVGFYIVFLVLSLSIGLFFTVIFEVMLMSGFIFVDDSIEAMKNSGLLILIIFNLMLGSKIIFDKKLILNFAAVILLILSIFMGKFLGPIFSLIPIAVLSSMSPKENQTKEIELVTETKTETEAV